MAIVNEQYGSGVTPAMGDTRRMLLVKLCRSSTGGSGSVPTFYNAPGPPPSAPPTFANIVVDSVGEVWTYWNGTWH